MERQIAELVTTEVIPLIRATLKMQAQLTLGLARLAEAVDHLTAELAEGEVRELRKLAVEAVRMLETTHVGGGRL